MMVVASFVRRGVLAVACLTPLSLASAQTSDLAALRRADSLAALAVADSALAAITRGDWTGLTDLMLPEARTFSARQVNGEWRYSTKSRAEERARGSSPRITERGFGATARVSGPLAVVWVPYDLYIDGAWSHCGVDAFTMYRVGGRWMIALLAWSVEQPPACAKHPQGPPSP